jgi:hypothetical protein
MVMNDGIDSSTLPPASDEERAAALRILRSMGVDLPKLVSPDNLVWLSEDFARRWVWYTKQGCDAGTAAIGAFNSWQNKDESEARWEIEHEQ